MVDPSYSNPSISGLGQGSADPRSLVAVLPGNWQVQIFGPMGVGQMRLEIFADGGFRGELAGPMGMSAVQGRWWFNPAMNQVGFQGTQTNGMISIPYGTVVQVGGYDAQQIRGVTSGGEQVVWQRMSPAPGFIGTGGRAPEQEHGHSNSPEPVSADDSPTARTTILFLGANPDDSDQLALDKECRAIREKIRSSDHPKSLEFRTEWAVRPDDLLQYLNEYRPHIVHFSGHGSENEELYLHDGTDKAKPISKAALRALFTTMKDNIRLVVLNACYSRPQAEAIVEMIDCAVGMNRDIGDDAAIVFAASFYRALGFGRSVKDAFEQGRTALLLAGIPEEKTPELLVRKGADASTMRLGV